MSLSCTYLGVCDTEYAHNTALKIGTALVNYYVPLAVMAVLYGRIFVAIRRRSKLEIWQNAVIVAGGGRVTSNENSSPGTSRRVVDAQDENGGEESDNGGENNHEGVSQQQLPADDDHSRPQKSSESRPDKQRGVLGVDDDVDSEPASIFERDRQSSQSPADGRRKCVRFLLVGQRESDLNDVEIDQIEMSVQQNNSAERSNSSGFPARITRLFVSRIPKRRRSSGSRPRQNSLSSDVKAAKQLGVIMGAFCVCFLPYFVCFVVVAVCRQCVGDLLMTTVTWVGYVNSTLNPFLYPLCNQQFRISFRRMFSNARHFRNTTRSSVATN